MGSVDGQRDQKSSTVEVPSSKSLKGDKDDSDWVPTIDTDIYNEAGGGRIEAEEIEKEDPNKQILV